MAAVEYDPVHAATHKFNFPDCEVMCRDLRSLSGEDLLKAANRGFARIRPGEKFPTQIDVIAGGPPCQGFSVGGKRLDGDERNSLLLEFVRLVELVRPRAVCLENVSGLLESRFDEIREEAFGRLLAAGYDLTGTESPLNAYDFGVPQVRRRVVIAGALGSSVSAPVAETRTISVEDALDGLPDISAYDELFKSDQVHLSNADLLRRELASSLYARQLSGLERTHDFSHLRKWDSSLITGSKRTVHSPRTVARFRETLPGTAEPVSRLYRLTSSGPARTLRAGTGSERGAHTSPRPIHPSEDRVVTVREAARLHGFPDWFRFHVTNWHGHRQIGNSVPPPLARAVASSILEALGLNAVSSRTPLELGDEGLLKLARLKASTRLRGLSGEIPPPRSSPRLN